MGNSHANSHFATIVAAFGLKRSVAGDGPAPIQDITDAARWNETIARICAARANCEIRVLPKKRFLFAQEPSALPKRDAPGGQFAKLSMIITLQGDSGPTAKESGGFQILFE